VHARLGDWQFAEAIAAGRGLPFDEAISDAVAGTARTEATAPGVRNDRDAFGLTPRERDVLRLLVAGMTDRQIADALCVSRRTVTTHTSSLFAKLGVAGRAEAAALAVRKAIA
jgi:DNA-binding NarL/FixJ family response regulator